MFGGRASKEDKENYAARAENYRDGRFYNDGEFEILSNTDREDGNILSGKGSKPEGEIPVKVSSYDVMPPIDEVQVTWFGHSSLLVQMHGMNILIDPVFSECSAPCHLWEIRDSPIR